MLRLVVLLLLLGNVAYWAWSSGRLRELGLAPSLQNEPQRVLQQIKPEALKRLTAPELRALESAPNEAAEHH
jgi:hypothetical protein